MAGPSSIAGTAGGVVPGQQAPDFSPISDSVSKMMDRFVQMTEAKKQHATEDLERSMKAVEAGFPIDPNHIKKMAKAAGMPLMKDGDMKAAVEAGKGGGATPTDTSQTKAELPDQGSKGVAAVKTSQGNAEQMKTATLDHWYNNAMQIAQKKGMNAQALLDYQGKVTEMKSAALNGDKEAVGKLMSANEIPFSIDKATWNGATDDEKHAMISIAAGHESEAQFNQRRDRISENLITTGKFKDPQMAMKAANALAHGADMPSDVKAAMTPNTFKELGEQAGFMGQLVELGVPSDKVGSTATAAQAGGLQNALPTGLKPLALQAMQERAAASAEQKRHNQAQESIEGSRVILEAGKFKAEEAHWAAMSAAADAKAGEERAKADLDQFRSLVELKKAGLNIDKQVLDGAQAKVADHLGVGTKEVNDWFHFLTGGTHQEFVPKPASDVATAAAGQKPKSQQQQPGTIEKLKKMMQQLKPSEPN
jgi:hypothetical protein